MSSLTERPLQVSSLRTQKTILLGSVIVGIVLFGFVWLQHRSEVALPHWFCYLGNVPLAWTHIISDSLIGASYVAISYTLWYLVRRSEGKIPFHWLVLAFGLFIVACGATHIMEVVTIWKPYYWISASIKILTAGSSVVTAIALPLMCPTILQRLAAAEASDERQARLEEANLQLGKLNVELREYESLRNSLVAAQAARIGDWEWNMETGENRWSEPVEVMHGLEPGTYDGRFESWWGTVHPEHRPVVQEAVARALATGDYEVEYRTVRRDGSIYWTAARGKVIYLPDKKPQRMLGICMDVTGRKRNEESLIRAEKLAAAGRLAATVAHEINNPIEAVMNLIFLARNNPDDLNQLLALADRELSRVAGIARQTLGFYRDNSLPGDFRLSDIVDQVLEVYSGKLESRGISLQTNIDPTAIVKAGAGDLHQIAANLIANAIDVSGRGDKIQVRVSRIPLESGDRAILEVEDQGAGVPPDVAVHLFEPFFTTKKDYGTGLGLWVSQRLANQWNGNITFTTSSSGSCFKADFPAVAVNSVATN